MAIACHRAKGFNWSRFYDKRSCVHCGNCNCSKTIRGKARKSFSLYWMPCEWPTLGCHDNKVKFKFLRIIHLTAIRTHTVAVMYKHVQVWAIAMTCLPLQEPTQSAYVVHQKRLNDNTAAQTWPYCILERLQICPTRSPLRRLASCMSLGL